MRAGVVQSPHPPGPTHAGALELGSSPRALPWPSRRGREPFPWLDGSRGGAPSGRPRPRFVSNERAGTCSNVKPHRSLDGLLPRPRAVNREPARPCTVVGPYRVQRQPTWPALRVGSDDDCFKVVTRDSFAFHICPVPSGPQIAPPSAPFFWGLLVLSRGPPKNPHHERTFLRRTRYANARKPWPRFSNTRPIVLGCWGPYTLRAKRSVFPAMSTRCVGKRPRRAP